jgi:hypothetical protein
VRRGRHENLKIVTTEYPESTEKGKTELLLDLLFSVSSVFSVVQDLDLRFWSDR